MAIAAFAPSGNGSALAVTTSSARVDYNGGIGARHVRIHNAGSVTAFVSLGGSAAAATVPTGSQNGTAFPVPAGAVEVLASGQSYVAAITSSGSTTLYITPGEGL